MQHRQIAPPSGSSVARRFDERRRDIARQAGVLFHHTNDASEEKHLVETMRSGGLFFDYDGDGWIDIFLVDGGSIADAGVDRRAHFDLGAAARADRLEVLWPSGRMEAVTDVPANQIITIEEGRFIVARKPFSR